MSDLIGKAVEEVGIEIGFADVKVGDVILFTLGFTPGQSWPEKVIDADPVVKVEDGNVYFDGPSYLAAADKADGAKVYIAKVAA